MKILITGGAGFIGSALTKKLTIEHEVTVIDLFDKIQTCDKEPLVAYQAADISSYSNLTQFEGCGFDVIYHLAAQTSGLISQEEPELDVDSNVKGTLNICRLAQSNENCRIIFSSSMAVYGNKVGAISEDSSIEPTSNYGASKASCELYLKLFSTRSVDYTIFRFFNAYGPGQDFGNMKQGMLSIYLSQAISKGHIDVTGAFERYRDFVYIDDIVSALVMSLSNSFRNEIFNVGSGIKTTVGELISLISQLCSGHITFENIGGFSADQFGTYSNSEKLENLGWAAKTSLVNGLNTTFEKAKEEIL